MTDETKSGLLDDPQIADDVRALLRQLRAHADQVTDAAAAPATRAGFADDRRPLYRAFPIAGGNFLYLTRFQAPIFESTSLETTRVHLAAGVVELMCPAGALVAFFDPGAGNDGDRVDQLDGGEHAG